VLPQLLSASDKPGADSQDLILLVRDEPVKDGHLSPDIELLGYEALPRAH
jgi:hypothetical protein